MNPAGTPRKIDGTEARSIVIGRAYTVSCVYAHVASHAGDETRVRQWWPIIGPWHDDEALIGFALAHFHIDWRFTDAEQEGRIAATRPHDPDSILTVRVITLADIVDEDDDWDRLEERLNPALPASPPWLAWRARVARRENPRWRARHWHRTLESHYRDATLIGPRSTWRCPHRGTALGNITPDTDGIIECPLHGLRWCTTEGTLISRAGERLL